MLVDPVGFSATVFPGCSGQNLGQVSRRIANLFNYENFAERYPEREEKEGVVESMTKAVNEFKNDLRALTSKEPVESDDTAAVDAAEEVDEEFSDENLM